MPRNEHSQRQITRRGPGRSRQTSTPPPIPTPTQPPPIPHRGTRRWLVPGIIFAWVTGLSVFGLGLFKDSNPDLHTPTAAREPATTTPVVVATVDKPVETPAPSPVADSPELVQPASAIQDGAFVLPAMALTAPASDKPACAADRTLGTAITWAESPQAAFTQARSKNKLVYLIHVSGNFEQEGYT